MLCSSNSTIRLTFNQSPLRLTSAGLSTLGSVIKIQIIQ